MPPDRKPLARCHSREVRITFRVTQPEAEALRAEAAARDVELSRLIRRWLLMGKRIDAVALHEKAVFA